MWLSKTHKIMASKACIFFIVIAAVAYATGYAPKVLFLSPSDGARIGGTNVKVVVSFSSAPDHPVNQLEMYLDNQLMEKVPFEVPLASGEQAFYLNASRLVTGPHSLTAKAYCSPQDVGEATIVVYVDNTGSDVNPPRVEILYPKEGAKLSGKVEVKIRAEDESGIKYVMLFIDDKFKFLKNYPPFTDMWDTTNYPNGPHILQAFAYDLRENKGESQKVGVIVDNPTGKTAMESSLAESTQEGSIVQPPAITPPPAKKAEASAPQIHKEDIGKALEAKSEKENISLTLSLPTKEATPPVGKGQTKSTPAEPKVTPKGGKQEITSAPALPVLPPVISKGETKSAPAEPKVTPKGKRQEITSAPTLPVLPPVISKGETKSAPISPAEAGGKTKKSLSLEATITMTPPSGKAEVKGTPVSPQPKETYAKAPKAKGTPLVVSQAPAPTTSTSSTISPANNNFQVHTIKKGECLIKIAKAYGIPPSTIASVNNLSNPDLIRAGEKLLIPRLTVLLNDTEVQFPDARPFAQGGLALVPFRAVFETAGGSVIWHAPTREVEAHRADKHILLKIGSNQAKVNEKIVLLEIPAFIRYSRTYVPASFFRVALDAQVEWDPLTGRLYISAP